MKSCKNVLLWLAVSVAMISSSFAQGTGFGYQGRLNDGAGPANGVYDLKFTLFGASTGGGLVAGPLTNSAVGATNGLFTVGLDFGANFPGTDRWLEIAVRTNGSGAFSTLAPRQQLTPTPYAMVAGDVTAANVARLDGAGNAIQVFAGTNIFTGANSFSSPLNAFAGGFNGDGASLTNLNAWGLSGNAGTSPTNGNFLGTTDNQAFDIRVNNVRVMRYQPTAVDAYLASKGYTIPEGAPNLIGGSPGNFVLPSVVGAVIAGGGATNIQGYLDLTNSVLADWGAIVGGLKNTIQINAIDSFIGGGRVNVILTNSLCSVIGGGEGNAIGPFADSSVICGGVANSIQTNAYSSFIGGGLLNSIATNAGYCFLGCGYMNTIQANARLSFLGTGDFNVINTNSSYAVLVGGYYNWLGMNSPGSVISGGEYNIVQDGATNSVIGGGLSNTNAGRFATIPGGDQNVADRSSFAAGHRAKAYSPGMFVWADSQDTGDFDPNVFGFSTNAFCARASAGILFTAGAAGANQSVTWVPGQGSWSFASDRNLKERFGPVDVHTVLNKVAELPLTEWSYIGFSQRHIGPMAQDFHSLFPLNENDKTLNDVDLHGVALAAIQALNEKVDKKDERIKEQGSKIEQQAAEIAALKRSVEELRKLVQDFRR